MLIARVRTTDAMDVFDRLRVLPRSCGTRLNPVGCACVPGIDTTRVCITFEGPTCATGVAHCIGIGDIGVWGHCEGQRPGVCECSVEGQVRECEEGPCGVSTTRCIGGRWSPCSVPVCPLDATPDHVAGDERPEPSVDAVLQRDTMDASDEEDAGDGNDAGMDAGDGDDAGMDAGDGDDAGMDAGDGDDVRDGSEETDTLGDTTDALPALDRVDAGDAATDRGDVTDVGIDRSDATDVTDVLADRGDTAMDAAADVPTCTPTVADVRACDATLPAPRPVAPLSFVRVTSRQPTLEWALPAGVDGAVVELCRDRACTMVLERVVVGGTSMRPGCPLPPGVLFWRLAGAHGSTPGCLRGTTPVWQFEVGALNARDTSWGVRFDVNGDGQRDVVLRSSATGSEPGSVMIALGAASGFGATGSFRTLAAPAGVVTFGAEALPAGDLNGDGYGDLLVRGTALGTDDDEDRVYLGGPEGIVAASGRTIERRYTLAGLENTQYAVGDFDRDGYGDLVIVRTHVPREATTMVPRLMQPRVDIYRGGPTGPAEGGPSAFIDVTDAAVYFGALTVADFDGDRRPEIALGARGEVIVIYDPLRSPRVVRSIRRPDVADSQRFGEDFLWTSDINGDGFGDLLVLGSGAIGTPGTWTWQGGAMGLTAGFTDRVATALFWTVVDVNNDGFDDLGARADATGYAFYTSTGRVLTATFRHRVTLPSTVSSVLTGDADGDGDIDVVARDRATNALLLYRGSATGTFTGPVRGTLPMDAPSGPSGNGAMAW